MVKKKDSRKEDIPKPSSLGNQKKKRTDATKKKSKEVQASLTLTQSPENDNGIWYTKRVTPVVSSSTPIVSDPPLDPSQSKPTQVDPTPHVQPSHVDPPIQSIEVSPSAKDIPSSSSQPIFDMIAFQSQVFARLDSMQASQDSFQAEIRSNLKSLAADLKWSQEAVTKTSTCLNDFLQQLAIGKLDAVLMRA
ncbi:hypothetical protein U1Q18_009689 [Sarracenia purpurea var. burkii]